MTCSTCGLENPPHLTFCQECGQRLGPRIAPPTPPIGLSGPDAYGPSNVQPAPPGATALGIGDNAPGAVPVTASIPATGGERRCKVCGTSNGSNVRYCTSCGSTLDPTPIALASVPAIAVGAASPAVTASSPANAIVPTGVVNLAGGVAPSDATRTCSRCNGIADGTAQFCKFCGNALGGEAAPPHTNGAQIAPVVPIGPAAPIAPIEPVSQIAPAPAASPQRGVLVVIAKSGADGASYPFGDLLDIGRNCGNVIVSEDPYLSPRHVRIVWNDGKLLLRDLGSTNGVFLRLAAWRDMGARRAGDAPEIAVPLSDQDLILVGQQVLRFDILREGEGGFGPAQEHGTLLFGSPAAPRYARLSQRTVEGIARDVYYVRKVETVLGRESGDVVFTEDPFLSRRHAAIRLLARDGAPPAASRPLPPTEARFALVDLGSSNGTFLRIRSDVELAPGDHFRVGQQLFRVDFEGARG